MGELSQGSQCGDLITQYMEFLRWDLLKQTAIDMCVIINVTCMPHMHCE